MKFRSLQTRLVLSIMGLAILVTLGPGSWMVWKSYGSLRLQAQQGQLALARSLAAQVDQSMAQAIQALDVLGKRPAVTKMDLSSLQKEISLVANSTEIFDSLCVVLPDGRIQVWSVGSTGFQNLPPASSYRSYFRQTAKLGEPVLSEVYKTRQGELAVAINSPIFRHKHMVGMLMGVLLLSNLGVGNLEEIHIGQSGYAYLVDDKGLAIVHPHKAKLLSDFSSNPAVKGLLTQSEGVTEFHGPDEKDVLAAYAKVESVSWGVIVRQPASECYAPADRMLRFLLIFLGLVVLGSAILALTLARRLVKPLLTLTHQVQRFEAGHWDPTKLQRISARDEIGLVAQAFSHMALALRTQQNEREKAHQRALDAEKRLAETERLALIGQLSAGLAHELNNPLAVIIGSAQEAAHHQGDDLKAWLQRVEREAQRCQRLVKDLLNFSKPIQLRRRRASLPEIISQAWAQALQGRQGTYQLHMNPVKIFASVDADRLKQVFINLFTNALDAMPQAGDVEVSITQQNGKIRISCRDKGEGLPKGDLKTLFRPFYTTKHHGTGLGLAITRSIMQAHGGDIWAERPRGKGARFVLEFPSSNKTAKS